MMKLIGHPGFVLTLALLLGGSGMAWAEDFYKGKTITILAGTGAGNVYDLYARLFARHMGKYVPGNPDIIVQNMPGAASMIAANHLANVTKPDGLTIGALGEFGRPYVLPANTPPDKVKIIREAFAKTIQDEAAIADATQKQLEIDPSTAEELEALAKEVVSQTPDIVARVKKLLSK